MSPEIAVITAAGTSGLVQALITAPPSSRLAFESVTIIPNTNSTAGDSAWNAAAGALKIGHSTTDGTFDDDSILAAVALPTSAAKVVTVKTTSNFATTLKTGSKAIQNVKYPIVPSGATVWATSIVGPANSVGQFSYAVRFWELDDENE
jgi:hypothetical protein